MLFDRLSCALHPDYIDTQFPDDEDEQGGYEGFKRLKFRYVRPQRLFRR